MKIQTYLLLAFWTLTQTVTSGQNFDGIGKLKIGIQTAEMFKILNVSQSKFKDASKNSVEWYDIYNATTWAVMVYNPPNRPKDDLVYRSYIHCPGASMYVIPEYMVSGIKVEGLTLLFLNDSLIEIKIKNPSFELTEAIDAKYGNGTTKDSVNIVTCSSIYGKTEYKEVTFRTTWLSENGIEAEKYLSSFRNEKCKELFVSYIKISNMDRANYAYKANEENWEKVREEIINRKKAGLDDL